MNDDFKAEWGQMIQRAHKIMNTPCCDELLRVRSQLSELGYAEATYSQIRQYEAKLAHRCSKNRVCRDTETQTDTPPLTPFTIEECRQSIKASSEVIRKHQELIKKNRAKIGELLTQQKVDIIRQQQELAMKLEEIQRDMAIEDFTV